MLTWFRSLFAEKPRLVELKNQVDDLESRVDYLGKELKALRGRVVGSERKEKRLEAAETDDRDGAEGIHPPGFPRGTAAGKRALRGF